MSGLPQAARIVAIQQENFRTRTIVLDTAVEAYPGQFVMVWLPRFDEKPFSLVNADPLTLMVTEVGPFSALVHRLDIGDRLWVRGPFGNGFHVPPAQMRLALVAGGYGVAPLHWLARDRLGTAARIATIIGARTADDILYADRFAALSEDRTEFSLHVTTEDGSRGMTGRVTDALEPLLAEEMVDGIYACGPHAMLAALERMGRKHGVPCRLSWEAYMRCGVGICGACEHEGRILCLDGPVLER